MESDELTLAIPGADLAARASGPAHGLRVLAVHGWQDSAASFDALAPHLPGARLVALDLVGHGRSGWRPEGVAYTFLDWVVDTHAALAALRWERCAIVGHSLGGALACCIAGAWPERVARLVLLDGFAPRTQPPEEGPERLAQFVAARARRRAPRVHADREAAAAHLARAVRGLSLSAARVLVTRSTRDVDGGVVFARDPRIADGPPLRLCDEQILAFLARVRCPVLWIRPRAGQTAAGERAAAARRALADCEVAEVDGGHHAHIDEAAAVAAIVEPFLARG
jgi:pimeloyl-ACP methyl ester carboxylesterase